MAHLVRLLNPLFPLNSMRNQVIRWLQQQYQHPSPALFLCVGQTLSGRSTFLQFVRLFLSNAIILEESETDWILKALSGIAEGKTIFVSLHVSKWDEWMYGCPFPVEVRQIMRVLMFESRFLENPQTEMEFYHDLKLPGALPALAEEFVRVYCLDFNT